MTTKVKLKKKKTIDIAGWREWVSLPSLLRSPIKAKLDTGAKTSSLHALDIEIKRYRGRDYVEFSVCPDQDSHKGMKRISLPVHKMQYVKSSTGHKTLRPVILTELKIGEEHWEIELNLVNRSLMGFRMLLGRKAMRKKLLVNSGSSFLLCKKKK